MKMSAALTRNSTTARLFQTALILVASLMLACIGSAPVEAAGGCSPYMGKVKINEVYVGKSKSTSSSNKVELFNIDNIDPSIWKTWSLQVYVPSSSGWGSSISLKTNIKLSSGFAVNGQFIYNSSAKIYLRNRDGKKLDIALLDANGDFIDYLAIDGIVRTVPSCFGDKTTFDATASKDKTTGDIARPTDGGSWPSPTTVKNTSANTIGYSNSCNSGGKDLIVNYDVDLTTPIINVNSVTYTLSVYNNSCSGSVTGIQINAGNITSTNFNSLSPSASQGSTSYSGSNLVWSVGTLNVGATATLTVTGTPKVLGDIASTASVSAPASGLVSTDNDSDTNSIRVSDYNYVGFADTSDTVTEGLDAAYQALITSNVEPGATITINYTVSGSAGSSDRTFTTTSPVKIDPSSTDDFMSTSIDFDILNDGTFEETKTIVLTITSITCTDPSVKLDTTRNVMIITLLDDDPSVSRFNAYETGTAAGAITGKLYTKLAGTSFSIDLAAINAANALVTNFDKSTKVELVDASGGAACSALPVFLTLSPDPTFVSGTGRKTVSLSSDVARRNAKVRITCSSPSCTTTIQSCSDDSFAIRPSGFTLTSSANAGGSTSDTPTVKAGASFTLTAASVAGYDGTPGIDSGKLSAHANAKQVGTLGGSFSSAASDTGSASGSGFTYGEVGYFRFEVNGVIDTSFTAIDAAASECTDDYSNTLVGGKYGCKIGNAAASSYFGRFIPDHFDTVLTAPMSCPTGLTCANAALAYAGQPFTARIDAKNASGGTTKNYDTTAGFSRATTLAAYTAVGGASAPAGSGAGSLSGNAATAGNFIDGSATLATAKFAFTTPPGTPTDIYLRASENSGGDGVSSLRTVAASSVEGGLKVVQGRLRLSNAFGNGKSALDVPLEAQFWSGNSWAPNSSHTSTLSKTAVAVNPTTTVNSLTLSNGKGSVQLAAPASPGSFDIALNLGDTGSDNSCLGTHGGTAAGLAWLRSRNGNCAASYDRDPSARATFGVYAPETRKTVHSRELY